MKKTRVKALDVTFADSLSQTLWTILVYVPSLFWVDCITSLVCASITSWYLRLLYEVTVLVLVLDTLIISVCVCGEWGCYESFFLIKEVGNYYTKSTFIVTLIKQEKLVFILVKICLSSYKNIM